MLIVKMIFSGYFKYYFTYDHFFFTEIPMPNGVARDKITLIFLSSANEVWVGYRNAGHPSFRRAVCRAVLPSVRLVNVIS